MPRGNLSFAMIQRGNVQKVAATQRETAGAVEAVAEQASGLQLSIDLIDNSVDGGLTATLGTKLADIETRLDALEP